MSLGRFLKSIKPTEKTPPLFIADGKSHDMKSPCDDKSDDIRNFSEADKSLYENFDLLLSPYFKRASRKELIVASVFCGECQELVPLMNLAKKYEVKLKILACDNDNDAIEKNNVLYKRYIDSNTAEFKVIDATNSNALDWLGAPDLIIGRHPNLTNEESSRVFFSIMNNLFNKFPDAPKYFSFYHKPEYREMKKYLQQREDKQSIKVKQEEFIESTNAGQDNKITTLKAGFCLTDPRGVKFYPDSYAMLIKGNKLQHLIKRTHPSVRCYNIFCSDKPLRDFVAVVCSASITVGYMAYKSR